MAVVKVMIVDDSAVVRMVLTEVLAADKEIEVIATAADPLFALAKMQRQWPDVIVLDVEMPRMDGITFLTKLMAERPTPVIICSTLTVKGAETTIQALAAGAVSVISKPTIGLKHYLQDASDNLIHSIKAAAKANLKQISRPISTRPVQPKLSADEIMPPRARGSMAQATARPMAQTTERIVALGTSTGGTQALERVLSALPRVCPGIVVVQHMPEKFTEAFARRLDSLCQIEVKEAQPGDRAMPGRALIAPGGRHMLLKRSGAHYQVDIVDGPLVSRHRPSVDVLFRSVAQCAGSNALGVIMTGMGDDGARGLKEMRDAGASTIVQDEESCVVFGMPKAAIKLGAVAAVQTLDDIVQSIVSQG